MTGYEIWLRSSPPRYSPAARNRNRQPGPASSSIASMNGTLSQTLVRNQYPKLKWCSFRVPSSDSLIEDGTREGIPAYPVPNENDGFTIVRRYLYDVLTGTGWGINDKYPAAIRAAIEGWYGNGGYFQTLLVAEDGLLNLCPEKGKDGEGKEVQFHEQSRELIRNCVRHETRVRLHRQVDLDDIVSEVDTYVDGNMPDIIVQEKACLQQNKEKGTQPAIRTSLESNRDPATASNQDQRDDSNPSKTVEHLCESTTSSQTIQSDTRDNIELALSYGELITAELRPKTSFEITHDIAVQEYAPKDQQLKKQEQPRANPRAVDGMDAGGKSVTGNAISSHNNASTPRLSRSEERLSGRKYARCKLTPPIKNLMRVELQIDRERSTKAVKQKSQLPLRTAFSISPIKSTRYETLPACQLPLTDDAILVGTATTVANKALALALNVGEARQWNHHERPAERKKGNIFSWVFGRLGGKKS